jgi:hypothetical protein
MTTDVITQAITAGGTVTFGRGRFFALLAATGPVTVAFEDKRVGGSQTQRRVLNNIQAGTKMTVNPGEEWTYIRLTSASAQNITVGVSDDNVEFTSAVSIVNTPSVFLAPTTLVSTPAQISLNSTQTTQIPANSSRKRLTVCGVSTNTGAVLLHQGAQGAVNSGIPIGPSTIFSVASAAQWEVYNPLGGTAVFTYTEEQ